MQANQLEFITLLSGDKLQQDIAAQAQRQNDRRGAFDQALAGLTDAKKEEIRKAMNVSVVDKSTKQRISYSDTGGLKAALAEGVSDAKKKEIGNAMKARVVDKPGKNGAALADKVMEDALAGLSDAKKKEIRKALSLRIDDVAGKKQDSAFSDQGQEEALDTYKATRKGRGLTKEDMKQVGAALKMISDAAQGVLAQKTSDGQPLFDTQAEFELALTQELFTPLVREGVLPENFVIDQYSEVQQLLDASFRSYKKRLTGQKDEQEGKDAEQAVKRSGAGSGVLGSQRLDQFLAGAKWLAGTPDRILDKGQQAVGMSNTTRRRVGVAMDVGKQAFSGAQALLTLSTLAPGPDGRPKMLSSAEVQLDPSKAAIFDRINGGTESLPVDPDAARTMIAHDKMEAKIKGLGLPPGLQDAVLKTIFTRREDTGSVATLDWTKGYATDLKTLIKDIGLKGYDTSKLDEAIATASHETANTAAAIKAARAIDAVLVGALDAAVRPGVGGSLKGRYARAVDVIEIGDAAGQAKPDDQALIRAYAAAFEVVFAGDIDPALAGKGKAMAAEFIGNAKGATLQDSLRKTPDKAFDPLIQVARAALDKTLKGLSADEKALFDAGGMRSALTATARRIDAALADAVKKAIGTATAAAKDAGEAAAEALSGIYAGSVDVAGAVKAAARDKPDGDAVVAAFANAFQVAFAKAAPDPSDKTFIDAGKAIAAELVASADPGKLASAMAQGAEAATAPLVQAAGEAIGKGLKGAGALVSSLQDPNTQRAIASKVFADGGEQAMEAMEQGDEELKAYERQLVLIDEGGIAAAEMQTIDKLIAQIERDRAIAEMIVTGADALTSLGITTTTIVGWTTAEVTDTLVGEIAGPLKAAKLIIQFSVAMKQANDRRILFNKIKRNLKRSKRAVSPLQSAIQGLFDNKVEQITFDAVEQALVLVQIAAAILGSVPEPITLAVSKSMSAAASAAEATRKITELIYDEVQLSRAWSTTQAAINNPRDRATGLKALRLNPTLAMHAIAWAGAERQPPEPTARMLLNDFGLNEQTLMVSGTEEKVRTYLETLLAEDRSLLDAELITPKWVPGKVTLSIEDWAVCVTRASRDAQPPIVGTTETVVLDAMKPVVKQDLDKLKLSAGTGAIEEKEMTARLAEVLKLRDALRKYAPISSDGADHEEMSNLAAKFLQMTVVRERDLHAISATNLAAQARDVKRVVEKLKAQTSKVDQAAGVDSFAAIQRIFNAAGEQIREVQMVSLDEDPLVKPDYDALMSKTRQLASTVAAMGTWVDAEPDWDSEDLAADWEGARAAAQVDDSTGLTPLLKAAQLAQAQLRTDANAKAAATKTLQDVIKNIDQRLSQKPDPGLALYLRQLKSGAVALNA